MIDKELLKSTVEKAIEGTDIFIVDITVSRDNNIVVEIDSESGLDIDTCARITREIENEFNRDDEDYELEVGSAGLTSPFKVRRQYVKNIGNEINVLTRDGRKLHGVLTEVGETGFVITTKVKEKVEGKKRPEIVDRSETFDFNDTKSVTYSIKFK